MAGSLSLTLLKEEHEACEYGFIVGSDTYYFFLLGL